MPVSEAQKKATAKYEKENYDKILVRFPKGTKELIQKSGAASINGYIIKCVRDSLTATEKESGVSVETQEAVKLMEILPESYREIALDFVKKLVLEWDPDYTKITDKEKSELDEAVQEFSNGETVSHDEINWN